MNDKLLMVGVAGAAAIAAYVTNSGPGPDFDSLGTSTGGSAPRVLPRMLADVRACTVDVERDAISGGLASHSCTVLRAGEEIEVQFWFSGNPNARAGDYDLEPCVRPASWPREVGVRDPRESKGLRRHQPG
jgi:hypothetical protein